MSVNTLSGNKHQAFFKKKGEPAFVWVASFLKERRHSDTIEKEWRKRFMRERERSTTKNSALTEALLWAYSKLHGDAEYSLQQAQKNGQLLFAFENTTVVEAWNEWRKLGKHDEVLYA